MKKLNLTEEEKMTISLLNNVSELIIQSNDRKDAKEVLKALKVFIKNKKINNFEILDTKINNFMSVMLDCRPSTLAALIKNMIQSVIKDSK